MAAEIALTRAPSEWRDRLRAYKLVVDGSTVASVKQGETVSVPVGVGRHRVWIKIDYARSPILEIDLRDGDRALFACRPSDISALLAAIRFTRYVALELRSVDRLGAGTSATVDAHASTADAGARRAGVRLAITFAAIPIAFVAGLIAHSTNVFIVVMLIGFVVSLVLRLTRR